ncbi:MAG: hypothetical protein IJW14_03930 [Oscillospiraceae bacterium]|nr:hypothetical protein [Oscillospiraceae bacterium]
MDLLSKLNSDAFWQSFLQYKHENENISAHEKRDLAKFVEQKEYAPVVERINQGLPLPVPQLVQLNKKHSAKKRTVFVFDRPENYVLKAVSYLLHQYDHVFPRNLYSFRKSIGVKKAIADLTARRKTCGLYSYKVDIHDYFNSVSTQKLLPMLRETLKDDLRLYSFLEGLLCEPAARCGEQTVFPKKGIMAGVPVSGFLANLYLKELDHWFADQRILYARYSDDIIVFAETAGQIAQYEQRIKEFLSKMDLTVNHKKEFRTCPGEPWEFLGFCVNGTQIDLAPISLQKMKDKMRRKAHGLVRWKKRTGACNERAIRAYIRHFNRKFYDNPRHHEVTWCRWYFPTITTSASLSILDAYSVECIRFIATGKHTKANYNLRYEEIKALGYRNLVNAYYHYKKTDLL